MRTVLADSAAKCGAFIRAGRPTISVFSASAVILGGLYSGDLLPGTELRYAAACAVAFLISLGTFWINDHYDLAADRENLRCDKMFLRYPSLRSYALPAGLFLYSVAVVASFSISAWAAVFIASSLSLFLLYSLGLKKRFMVKNLIVGYGFVAPILLGTIVMDLRLEPLIIYFCLMSFLAGLAFEIMIDIADVRGDAVAGVSTIAVRYSPSQAARIATVFFVLLIVLDPLPFFFHIDPRLQWDSLFLALIAIPMFSYIFIASSLLKGQPESRITQLRTATAYTMAFGCLVYAVGVLT